MTHPISKHHHRTQSPIELLPKPKGIISKKGKKTSTSIVKNLKHVLKINILNRYDLNYLLQEEKKAYRKALKAEELQVEHIDFTTTKLSLLIASLSPFCKKEARCKENFFFVQKAKGALIHLHHLLKDHKEKLEELSDDIEGIEESIKDKEFDLRDESRKILKVEKGIKKIIPLPKLFAIYKQVSKIKRA